MDPPDIKATEGEGEQAKKRRGRKKSKLEDMFPAYLQEAFFGKTLLDLSKRAVLAPLTQRPSQGLLRPPLSSPGSRPAAPESGKSGLFVSESNLLKCIYYLMFFHYIHPVAVEVGDQASGVSLQLKQEADGTKPPGEIKSRLLKSVF